MMTETKPLVTVITPTYNNADYLAETIESVLSQDYDNIEYIVLDDGSSDDTVSILKQYADRIIGESHANMGEARTVNKGFGMATGQFVMVVNGDDPLLPKAISTQVTYLQAHPEVQATYPDWLEIDENSEPFMEQITWDYDYATMIRRAACVPGPAALIRKSGIDLISGRNTNYRFVSDMDFWFRLGLHGPLAHIPQFLATHRTHRASSGIAFRPNVGKEIVAYMEMIFQQYDLPDEIQRLKGEALSSAYFEAGARATSYQDRRRYFLRSFRLYPLNWIKYPHGLWQYGALILPEFVYNLIRPLFKPYKWLKQGRNVESKENTS